MALPDISTLSLQELRELIQSASLLYNQAEIDYQEDVALRKTKIGEAISELEELLGPENAPPNISNIRGILQYTQAEMAANSGLAISLSFQALEIATKTLLEIAHIVPKD